MGAGAVLARYLRPEGRRLSALAVFMLAGIAGQLVSPPLMGRFIDTVVKGGRHTLLTPLFVIAGLYIAAAIATQLFQIGATYFSAQLAWSATNRMRRDLATHVLHLDMSYHTGTSPGDIIERVDGDVAALANFFSQFVLQVVGGGLLLIGIMVVLVVVVDWRIGVALGAVALVAGLVMFAMRNVARDQWERLRDAFSAFSAFLEERLAGLDDVRANAGGAHVMRRFRALTDELAASNIAASRRGPWVWLVPIGIFSIGLTVALGLGGRLYLMHGLTMGTLVTSLFLAGMMQNPVLQIGSQLQQFQTAAASLERIRGLLALHPTLEGGPGVGWDDARTAAPNVAFEHIDFAYRADTPVLKNVSIEVKPGEVLGLLGRTGSGKTTLTRLLFRLYDPVGGRIALDGEDIRGATLEELRGRIGLVTQEVQLFDASVRDNATLFDPNVPDARIVEVLTDLGLGGWLERQPRGLDAVLTAGGGLSAGEAQLLAFARVFLKDPGLVVLDEASSRLDPASDLLIERALDKLLGGGKGAARRTAIIIAHKLSTVGRADRIVILDHGRVLEAGERTALEADPSSTFAKLLNAGMEEALA